MGKKHHPPKLKVSAAVSNTELDHFRRLNFFDYITLDDGEVW
jgi:hypothetical protein